MRAKVFEESLELLLHRVHFLPHIQDDLNPGKVHAEIARERQDHLQALKIFVGEQTGVALRTRRLDQALTGFQEIDAPWHQGLTWLSLGQLARAQRDEEQAQISFVRALDLFEGMDARFHAKQAKKLMEG